MGEVQRAMSSSVSRRKKETTHSNVYKQQLIKKCLDGYCVSLEMKKALSSHTDQVKGLPLLWVNLLQHGMMITREKTRRWLQHIPDVQNRTHELHLFLPPQLQNLFHFQISEVRWDKSLLFPPAAPSYDLLGSHWHFECVAAASELSLPEMLVIEIMCYVLYLRFKLKDCRVRRAFQKPFSPFSCPSHLNHSWQKFA